MEKKIFYLTEKGLKDIKKEQRVLENLRTAKVNGEAPKILESEDLNPEYLSFQEDMDFLETRLAELKNIIKNARLIKPPKDKDQVALGATLVLEIDKEDIDELKIVGTLEANPSLGMISNESPVGKALIGHKAGEEITISSPVKTIYKIKKIIYEA